MATLVIDQFAPLSVSAGDITLRVVSSTRIPTESITGLSFTVQPESETSRLLVPDPVWLSGTSFTVTVNGTELGDVFTVREDSSCYFPEEYLYSNGLLETATTSTLVENGFLTTDEKSLIDELGTELELAMESMADGLSSRFSFNGTVSPKPVRLAVCFRVMQQIFYTLGMGSFVESILLSPGPTRSWFNRTYISLRKLDSEVKELFPIVKTHTDAARAAISKAGLNTEVIDSVSLQVPPTHPLHDLAVGIATLFCAIRYTHDNDRFSY